MNAIKNNNNTIGLCSVEEIDKRVLCFKCEEDCPLPHTAEFQFTINDEIRTDFQSVCKECYDDWEDICEKCDSRVCSVEMWIDYKGEWIYYCDECYAEDEDRITETCADPYCERQCIEDEDFCLPCKECREGVDDDEEEEEKIPDGAVIVAEFKGREMTWTKIDGALRKEEEEVKVEEPVLTEKQKERITRIRLQRQENEAMGAEDFDAPEPEDTEIRGFCIQCDQEGKFIGKEGDEWTCPSCEDDEEDDENEDDMIKFLEEICPQLASTPAPVRSTWDDRVSGDLKNQTICEMFGDECTWRTLANIGADPDAESELSVHIHYYNEGKHFQVRARVNDCSILDRHYSAPGNGERFPDTLMEELVFYFPGYFEEGNTH
jgi:hypothetical protein